MSAPFLALLLLLAPQEQESIMHTLCDEFDYVYYLFHDESNDKKNPLREKSDVDCNG